MRAAALFFVVACAQAEPLPANPVQSVSVAPHGTGSPSEPTLLLAPQARAAPPGDVERVKVLEERPDVSWKPPKDRCPDGITELISAHLQLGATMELAPGAAPVRALGDEPECVEVVFDRSLHVVRMTARKFGLVYVLVERDNHCTLYGVTSGY